MPEPPASKNRGRTKYEVPNLLVLWISALVSLAIGRWISSSSTTNPLIPLKIFGFLVATIFAFLMFVLVLHDFEKDTGQAIALGTAIITLMTLGYGILWERDGAWWGFWIHLILWPAVLMPTVVIAGKRIHGLADKHKLSDKLSDLGGLWSALFFLQSAISSQIRFWQILFLASLLGIVVRLYRDLKTNMIAMAITTALSSLCLGSYVAQGGDHGVWWSDYILVTLLPAILISTVKQLVEIFRGPKDGDVVASAEGESAQEAETGEQTARTKKNV